MLCASAGGCAILISIDTAKLAILILANQIIRLNGSVIPCGLGNRKAERIKRKLILSAFQLCLKSGRETLPV